jgi:hypothetical protein
VIHKQKIHSDIVMMKENNWNKRFMKLQEIKSLMVNQELVEAIKWNKN